MLFEMFATNIIFQFTNDTTRDTAKNATKHKNHSGCFKHGHYFAVITIENVPRNDLICRRKLNTFCIVRQQTLEINDGLRSQVMSI